MQGDQKPIQAFCFHSEHLCRPASRQTSTWPSSPLLSRAPGTRADGHPHIAAASRCDPPPSEPEPGGRGEEVRTPQQGPRGTVRVAHPGHRGGSRLGHDPPLRHWRPREPSAREPAPAGEQRCGAHGGGRGRRAWGALILGGGSAREGVLGRDGAERAQSGASMLSPGGARSVRREVGCSGGGTHAGGSGGLAPGTRRPRRIPRPEPRVPPASTRGLRIRAPALTAGPARSVLRPPSVCPSQRRSPASA